MKLLQLFRISLAELFALVTFVALSCVALLNASDTTAWIVGGLFWLALLVAIAGSVSPGLPRRPFFLGFLGASLLHLYLMQYTAGRGHTTYDLDMPTFYLTEVLWDAVPRDHWHTGSPFSEEDWSTLLRTRRGSYGARIDPTAAVHANFQGIATQLFSIFYGALAGALAQSFTRASQKREPNSA